MMLAGRGVRDESLWIVADLLELIVGCTTCCRLSDRAAGSLKGLSCVSSNSGVIMTGIVEFYDLTVMIYFSSLLLTKILRLWVDFLELKI